jgi:hypothetical protein
MEKNNPPVSNPREDRSISKPNKHGGHPTKLKIPANIAPINPATPFFLDFRNLKDGATKTTYKAKSREKGR